jgi:hypothetical protein
MESWEGWTVTRGVDAQGVGTGDGHLGVTLKSAVAADEDARRLRRDETSDGWNWTGCIFGTSRRLKVGLSVAIDENEAAEGEHGGESPNERPSSSNMPISGQDRFFEIGGVIENASVGGMAKSPAVRVDAVPRACSSSDPSWGTISTVSPVYASGYETKSLLSTRILHARSKSSSETRTKSA